MKNSPQTLEDRNRKRRAWKESVLGSTPKTVIRVCVDCKRRRKCPRSGVSQTGNPEYRARCNSCHRAYGRQVRKNRAAKIAESKRVKGRQKKEACVKLLGGKCVRCGYDKNVCALTFHHVDPTRKKGDISRIIFLKSWETVLEELKECELLCFNCHMEEEDAIRSIEIGRQDELQVL